MYIVYKVIINLFLVFNLSLFSSLAIAETQSLEKTQISSQESLVPLDIIETAYPYFRIFNDNNGLPQNAVKALAFDQNGYLWIGTQDGVAYYNGRKWQSVNLPNRNVSNWITVIKVISDGSILFGKSDGGVCQLKNGQWIVFTKSNSGLPDDNINDLLETTSPSGKSVLWFATEEGLAKLEDNQWKVFNTTNSLLPGNVITSLVKSFNNGEQVLWIGSEGGLTRLEKGEWKTFDSSNSKLPADGAYCLMESHSIKEGSKLWIGTPKGLAYLKNNSGEQIFTVANFYEKSILSLTASNVDNEEVIWIGTSKGLFSLQNDKVLSYTIKSGLPDNIIISLIKSPEKNRVSTIWVGTLAGGLVRFDEKSWLTLNTNNGLPDNHVYAFLETTSDKGNPIYWIGSSNGLARFELGQWKIYNTSNGLPNNRVNCLKETIDQDGTKLLWVGTFGGLAYLKNNKWTILNQKLGLPSLMVRDILETVSSDNKRSLWVATYGGLARLEEDTWTIWNKASGFPEDYVMTLLLTKSEKGKESLWVGTNGGGLAKYENNTWTYYNDKSGLPNNQIRGLQETISQDGKHILWVGTHGGVAWTEIGTEIKWKVLSIDTIPALPNNVIYNILEDKNKQIYLTSNKGVIRLDPNVDGFQLYNFTGEDGLPSNECNGGAAMVDNKGRIWVGTVNGATIIDPNNKNITNDLPALLIEKILLNNKLYLKNAIKITDKEKPLFLPSQEYLSQASRSIDQETFNYSENNLVFEYALLSYHKESNTFYRTQLVGIEENSSEWTTDYKREFPILGSGQYLFRVWAKDYTGNISGPIEMSFYIKPAPWKTWWAYFIYLFLFGGGVYGGINLRIQVLKNRNIKLESIVQERTTEIAKQKYEIEKKNEHILDSILYAKRIQQTILPNKELIERLFPEQLIFFKPKDIVSGDFYWLQEINGNAIFAVADCTGHGVPGALMSMLGSTLLNQIVLEKRITNPGEILENLHDGIRHALKQSKSEIDSEDGMDIAICQIDMIKRQITFAGAKRPFYYIDTTKELVEIKGDKKSVGGKQKENQRKFTNHTISVSEQMAIYLVTDGFADQNDKNMTKYGSNRLKQFLQKNANYHMIEQYAKLSQELAQHQQEEAQRDDITVIGLLIK